MKVKTLRNKDTHEFIFFEKLFGTYHIFTDDVPKLFPNTITFESILEKYPLESCDFDSFDNIELVEFDLIESGEVGADIRNKLTPCFNLIALLKLYFNDNVAHATEKRASLAKLIKTEMEKSKENIKYIVNLL